MFNKIVLSIIALGLIGLSVGILFFIKPVSPKYSYLYSYNTYNSSNYISSSISSSSSMSNDEDINIDEKVDNNCKEKPINTTVITCDGDVLAKIYIHDSVSNTSREISYEDASKLKLIYNQNFIGESQTAPDGFSFRHYYNNSNNRSMNPMIPIANNNIIDNNKPALINPSTNLPIVQNIMKPESKNGSSKYYHESQVNFIGWVDFESKSI